ncbi:MAG: transcriptional regulator [Phycisphaeraceae bacterium]|nr:transcriptional regulator [Phycisphaeraceae bacterium]
MPRQVVIGLLGPTLDRGHHPDRWSQWRPSVSLCRHEDHLIDEFNLLHEPQFTRLADQVAEDIRSVSPETDVRQHVIAFGDPWDFEDVFAALYDFASGYPFDTDRDEYLVHMTTGTHVAQICLFLLTESRHLPARLLQTSPPRKREPGGPGDFRTIDLDLSRYDQIAQRYQLEQTRSLDFLKSGIDTRDAAFNRMIEQIEYVAIHSSDTILLTGPTGAGKSQLARRIYELKRQRRQVEGPLIDVNCATIRGDTAMSTLFGHTRGAFTGAVQARRGLLAEANGGMLFLDEIGELGPDEQSMLLRAIEQKRFLPVGADTETASDFLLICGTNRDLQADVRTGRFREDLLARIDLWTFRLPGLNERPDDIAPNVQYELEQLTRRTGRQVRFNREARDRFLQFALSPEASWRGNFRDLNASMRRMATMAPAGRINAEVVDDELGRLRRAWTGTERDTPGADALRDVLDEQQVAGLDLFDRAQLEEVVRVCRTSSSLSDAGRKLFAVSRSRRRAVNDADRLRKYLAKFDLDWSRVRNQKISY